MRLVVTGASGKLGRLVVAELLERVPASELILLSRSPDALAEFAQRGAVVRFADFVRPDGLSRAFAGAERALIISTIGTQDAVADHRRAFEAAAEAGVQHITYTSVPNPVADNPFPPARTHRHSEQDLRSTGVGWTILRNALYADLRVDIGAPIHFLRKLDDQYRRWRARLCSPCGLRAGRGCRVDHTGA